MPLFLLALVALLMSSCGATPTAPKVAAYALASHPQDYNPNVWPEQVPILDVSATRNGPKVMFVLTTTNKGRFVFNPKWPDCWTFTVLISSDGKDDRDDYGGKWDWIVNAGNRYWNPDSTAAVMAASESGGWQPSARARVRARGNRVTVEFPAEAIHDDGWLNYKLETYRVMSNNGRIYDTYSAQYLGRTRVAPSVGVGD